MKTTNIFLLIVSLFTQYSHSASAYNSTTLSTSTVGSEQWCEVPIKLYAHAEGYEDLGGRTGITSYHEGAGINYIFLTGTDSYEFIYNRCLKQIYIYLDFSKQQKQFLSMSNGFVSLTVVGPSGQYDINPVNDSSSKYLYVNGSPDGWLACKDTNDPYNYSKTLYQLLYRGATFENCKSIMVEVQES